MLISITGPECSGKTTLTKYLSAELHANAVKEFAREYLHTMIGQYTVEDLDIMAQRQLEAVAQHSGSMIRGDLGTKWKEQLVITDTFLLVLLIWSLRKYGKVSATIQGLYAQYQPDFYLLCRPDIPWEYDILRENQNEREELFEIYLQHIQLSGVPYYIVKGLGEERMRNARYGVETFIKKTTLGPPSGVP